MRFRFGRVVISLLLAGIAAPSLATEPPARSVKPKLAEDPAIRRATADPKGLLTAGVSRPAGHGSPAERRGYVPAPVTAPLALGQVTSSDPGGSPHEAEEALKVRAMAGVTPTVARTDVTRAQGEGPNQLPPPATALQTVPPLPAGKSSGEPMAVVGTNPQPSASVSGGGPIALAAHAVLSPQAGKALLLPFGPKTGAAAFGSGGYGTIVFDERRPLDMAALSNDPDFASANVQLFPGATMLRLKLRGENSLGLARSDSGWVITILDGTADQPPAALRPIRAEPDEARLRLPAEAPNAVVSIPDPETGRSLMVGTQSQPGQAVLVATRLPELVLRPTWQGVVVEPASDSLVMRIAGPGFVVASGVDQRTLALSAPDQAAGALSDARRLTRRYDFPALSNAALERRLQNAVADAAGSAPQARGAKRLDVAQAMIALGLGSEAQALIELAGRDDARLADDPNAIGLRAIAAMLAGRLPETSGIEDPRLAGSDEITFWRAVRLALRDEGSPQAASAFAATMPLALAYPGALRERLLPLLAETVVLGGERAAASALLSAHSDDPTLSMARALFAKSGGQTAEALEIFDQMAAGQDRLIRSRAAIGAVETRLTTKALTVAQAADALDKQVYAWRGDAREMALRERIADLRAQSGAWRSALAMLRDADLLWPERHDALRMRMQRVFDSALAADGQIPLPPLELITLADENPDLVPDGDAGQSIAARLADRLVSLDLPVRAVPVLQKLMTTAAAGSTKAEFGERLASLRIQLGDPTAALVALSASTAESLPAPLLEARTLTYARAESATGHTHEAVAALMSVDSAAADDLRAQLLETAKDTRGAEAALASLASRLVPPGGRLDETQVRILLRLASAAAQAGDEAMLERLRDEDLLRMPDGGATEMFRVLTTKPVASSTDLPRSGVEAKLVKGLPTTLDRLSNELSPAPARAVAAR